MTMQNENIPEKAATKRKSIPVQPAISSEEALSLPPDELLVRLETSPAGLDSQEAEHRLEIYGRNEFARKKKRAAILNFLSRFKSPLVIILIIAGGVSAALDQSQV